jgi:glutathione S-transferase
MLLIGQFDSPFVRRVGVALELYGIAYEHRPWSVWRDADKIAAHNPLLRVPTLVLDDGESLLDSAAILDALDEQVGPERALLPRSGPLRRDGLRVMALAMGLGDKAVSYFYEKQLHPEVSQKWLSRCETQIRGVLAALEADRTRRTTPHWLGATLSHADIAVACVLRFLTDSSPGAFELASFPALTAHSAGCESLSVFRKISQPFSV